MRKWLSEQLKPALDRPRPIFIIDTDSVVWLDELNDAAGGCEIYVAHDWFELRKIYERDVRNREAGKDRALIVIRADEYDEERDLPYDIENAGSVVVVLIPGPPELRMLIGQLPGDKQDAAVIALTGKPPRPVVAMIRRVWGVEIEDVSEALEFQGLVRLRTDDSVPPQLWQHLAPVIKGELSRPLTREPPDLGFVQKAWQRWLAEGRDSPFDNVFRQAGVGIAPLFHVGLLKRASTSGSDTPAWTGFGVEQSSPVDTVSTLLAARPEPWPPQDLASWVRVAEWWGEVRAALAEGGHMDKGLAERAWSEWAGIDDAFRPWLRENFGRTMLSSARWPATVDKIAPFLASRMTEGAGRILLVLMDGMGFAQWSILRTVSGVKVEEAGGSMAMVPTLTPISRQAIFAGMRPSGFPDSLMNTMKDGKRWEQFWATQAETVSGARYNKVMGRFPDEMPEFGTAKVVGMVIEAIDKTLHGAELLGDAQVAAAVRLWGAGGHFRSLVEKATSEGFEVWVTSDHGNLEVLPSGRVLEGLAVETAGVRVRIYPTESLRSGKRTEGESWDPPGLPKDAIFPSFAFGREGYFSSTGNSPRVTHGGISLDEVIVPLVRVSP